MPSCLLPLRSNSVDLDEVAHNEPPHLDLHCLRSSTALNTKHYRFPYKKGSTVESMENYPCFFVMKICRDHHKNRLGETFIMRCHNFCFH